ncbi:putative methyl-accepting chemotaxis protein [Halobacteriovorax marinus SJ]|uniref:Methyl-accepting chemotaxis protein n=1 Tax=Halobacteriovorax marinus (strain ATCC BAA-682 / DSM 15412 / SJ) TaxID=862908 RepID=E1X671_HALMS|nr:methyl-accepting chemotaxis protein [Halobacteriovorax marinus]CBW27416.1 putative methyl-accepting chemotaxis protein [Halobacteriovorax marinus SJ]
MSISKKKSSFQFKLLLTIVTVAFVCITIVASISYFKSKNALQAQSINQFSSMGEMMKNRLSHFEKQTKTFSERLGQNRLIEGLFLAYESAFYGASLFPGEDQNINTDQYKSVHKIYGERALELVSDYSLENILLVSLDGQVIMSSKEDPKANLLGRSLTNGAYSKSSLAKCFQKALDDEKAGLHFSGYEYNQITNSVVAFYCIRQLAEFDHLSEGISKGDNMGVVISQVNISELNSIVSSRVGMGETGQVYLVGDDNLLRTDFFVNKEKFNTVNSFKNKAEVHSPSIDAAVAKKTGTHFIVDPNGEEVLSYYSSISMFGRTWGLIAEIQTSEMFAPVRSMMIFVTISSVVALFIIILIGAYVTKLLVKPIVDANKILSDVTHEVSSNADKMKSNSVDLSDGSTKIASAIQETVSTLDELSSMVSRNLENVELSSKKSGESKVVAESGKQSVTNMIAAMGEINNSNSDIVSEMDNISHKMNEIIDVINEIGSKTDIINDIVFQTKLLSFNASVEAARAGEHGKGFAVVAEEVGSLATASGSAATEISEMLGESVKKVEAIVADSKSKLSALSSVGKEKVDIGTKTANECEQVLDQILVNVLEVNDKVSEITNASNEQAIGINEVSKAMSQLDEMTHQTTLISTEALESSEGLNSQANKLASVADSLSILVSGGIGKEVEKIDKQEVQKQEKLAEKNEEVHDKSLTSPVENTDESESGEDEVKDTSTEYEKNDVKLTQDLPSRDDSRFEDI